MRERLRAGGRVCACARARAGGGVVRVMGTPPHRPLTVESVKCAEGGEELMRN